ncbi:MAG: 50S ribosomal protein L29 [Bacteroidales bacterium]|jgi:large subunit ribosomal protein L29|nr:50S ribosomal protein L29 [Bacteroidales bacterium]MBQ5404626.1 50S ribosomal protein L29 [Bacteroidales bacterium]MBR6278298.1 50S ribosomal protein L29 [Bacteroidales bacterium]
MKKSVQNKEIKELTTAELEEKLNAAVLDYTKMKLNHAITPLESPIQIRDKRKYIARLRCELRSRQINNAQ